MRSGREPAVSTIAAAVVVVVIVAVAAIAMLSAGVFTGPAKSGSTSSTASGSTSASTSSSTSTTQSTSATQSSPTIESLPITVNDFYVAQYNQSYYAYGFNFTLTNSLQSALDFSNYSIILEAVSTTREVSYLNTDYQYTRFQWQVPYSDMHNTTDVPWTPNHFFLPPGQSGGFFGAFVSPDPFTPSVLNLTLGWDYGQFNYVLRAHAMALASDFPPPTRLSFLNITSDKLATNAGTLANVNVETTNLNSYALRGTDYYDKFPSSMNYRLFEWLFVVPGFCNLAPSCGVVGIMAAPGQEVVYQVVVDNPGAYFDNQGDLHRIVVYVDSVASPSAFTLKLGPSPFPIPPTGGIPSMVLGADFLACLSYDYQVPATPSGTYVGPYTLAPWNVTLSTAPATQLVTGNGTSSGQNWIVTQSTSSCS